MIKGEDMKGVPPFKRPVNTVFQSYALFPHMTVLDNVAYGLRNRGMPKKLARTKAEAALESVALQGLGDRRPHELSGGQQQRVALVRALVNEPAILLLDEPLGALDAKLRIGMRLELKRIQRQVGVTFIYVTHDQEEAMSLSDRVAVMNKGRIVQIGTPADILRRPVTSFVADFVWAANMVRGTVVGWSDGMAEVEINRQFHCWVPAESYIPTSKSVLLCIRTRDVAFANGSTVPGVNTVAGQIGEVLPYGDQVEASIICSEGLNLRCQIDGWELSHGSLYPGAEVVVTFPREKCRLFTD